MYFTDVNGSLRNDEEKSSAQKKSKKAKFEKNFDEDVLNNDYKDDDKDYNDLERQVLGIDDEDVEKEMEEFLKSNKKRSTAKKDEAKKAKWVDEDDSCKKPKVESSVPSWAIKNKKLKEEDEDEDEEGDEDDDNEMEDDADPEDEITWRTGNYMASSRHLLQKNLNFFSCPAINRTFPSKGKLRVLKMMRRAQVAIVGGADSKLSIFQVDGKENRKIQTIAVENFPIFSAELNVPEDEIIIGSMFPTFVMYNMDVGKITRTSVKNIEQVRNTKLFTVSPDGKLMVLVGTFGHVHVLSIKSKGLLQTLKSESESIEAVTFSSDGEMLFTHSSDGVVYVWNMKTFKCMFKFQDEGCTQGTTIHISSNSKYLATGSHTGVVNLYETSSLLSMPSNSTKFCLPQPKPLKAIPNITTTCTAVKFNENSELLAMASNYAEGSVKLFHTRSLSVLANFPNPAKPLGIPYSLDFSPNSGYFSVGNHHGVAHLFRLKHYSKY